LISLSLEIVSGESSPAVPGIVRPLFESNAGFGGSGAHLHDPVLLAEDRIDY
jgi:hypothetical protein